MDRDPGDEHSVEFENLVVFEINQLERAHLPTLVEYISGDWAHLQELRVNLGPFDSTNFKPSPGKVEFLRTLYEELQEIASQNRIRAGLEIYCNGVQLDPKRLKFEDYCFHQPLIQMHNHNRETNRLKVLPCRSVIGTEYLDVIQHFQPDKPNRFQRFHESYPNMMQVRISRLKEEPVTLIQSLELFKFLDSFKPCSLTALEFLRTGLLSNFYAQLFSSPSCRALMFVCIVESTCFTHNLDFHPLSNLKFLRKFETNASPRQLVLDLLLLITNPSQRLVIYFLNKTPYARVLFKQAAVKGNLYMSTEFFLDVRIPPIDESKSQYNLTSVDKILRVFGSPKPERDEDYFTHWIPYDSALHRRRLDYRKHTSESARQM